MRGWQERKQCRGGDDEHRGSGDDCRSLYGDGHRHCARSGSGYMHHWREHRLIWCLEQSLKLIGRGAVPADR